MSAAGSVRLERRDAVAWLVLDRPEARNALTVPMRHRAIELLAEAESDDDVGVIALTGAGEHFCGGGDVASMPEVRDVWEARARTATAHAVVTALRAAEKPTIAVARGAVAGLGISLFAACDVRLAAADARFQPGFPGVGLIPDGGLLHLLPRLVGFGRASEWLLLDHAIGAAEALSWGLASRVAEADELDALAGEVAARLARVPRRTAALTKAGLRLAADASWESVAEFERTAQGALLADPESRALVRAFLGLDQAT
ncbi:MAG: 2-(1,2-epoxy,2-dihydrophenyl)acetyl-CoA isomerase [Solirubrobacteraceae bacterium]|jgi:2-(1,2-epoxy-1,2-dihydrophenyl)acetyl-CoA isomerase|nr:2-(1,2-epoxy,2-dihydrophenyl)acetyl-CoA isomerase [Solirubrobacteraceae bacterium]